MKNECRIGGFEDCVFDAEGEGEGETLSMPAGPQWEWISLPEADPAEIEASRPLHRDPE